MKQPNVTPPQLEPSASDAARHPRWSLLIGISGLCALFLVLAVQRIWAVDLWWQLRTGQYVLEHGFPTTDAYSYTVPDHAWIELRWLFCVLTYKLYSLAGTGPLILLETLVVAATFGLYAANTRKAAMLPIGLFTLAVGVLTAHTRFVVRPELCTFLFMAIFVVVLDARRRGKVTHAIWALPILQVLWVNSHTLFVFGPVTACSFAGADTLSRWWRILTLPDRPERAPRRGKAPVPTPPRPKPFDVPLCASACLIVGACLLNPWGAEGALFPLILLEETRPGHVLAKSIEEFGSPFFGGVWTPAHTFACILTAIGGVTFALNWRRTDIARLFLWSALVYFGATSARNLGLLGFFGAWAALANLRDMMDAGVGPRVLLQPAPRMRTIGYLLVGTATLFTAWSVLAHRFLFNRHEPRPFAFGTMRAITPSAATEFLLRSGAMPQLFHSMRDASYLTWAAGEKYKVFVDGRLEVYTGEFVAEYLNFLGRDWDAFTEQHSINVVMVNRDEIGLLASRLALRPQWMLVYLDDVQTVWVRDIPEHAELIARSRIDLTRPWTPLSPEPDEEIEAWRRAIGARGYPWHSMGMARQFLALAAAENAATYLERAYAIAPWNSEISLMLAQVERWRGNEERASRLLAGVSLSEAQIAGGDRMLADLLITSGREAEAIPALERCAAYFANDPGGYAVYAKLARAYAAANRPPDAARAFREASRLAPRVAEFHENLATILAAQGDRIGAKAAYEQALSLDPRRPDLLVTLGGLMLELGQPAEARKCFEYALKMQPDYAPAREALQRVPAGR